MAARRPLIALASVFPLLLLGACHDETVTSYRIPKEADAAPAANTAPAAPPADNMGAVNSGGANGMTGSVPTESGPSLTWKAPSSWQVLAPGAMRKASYKITTSAGTCDLSVTAFPGDVGGELANVNRWRGQAGLSPVTADTLDRSVDRIEVHGLHLLIADLGDATSPNRIIGVIVPFNDGVWFFKLAGPGAAIEQQKAAFLAFLKTIEPPTT